MPEMPEREYIKDLFHHSFPEFHHFEIGPKVSVLTELDTLPYNQR